ncbi:adenylate kinase [Paragonimus westermani]|uniref:Adenylate kinase n=1 Tax=Paragonimus westermani TaxID=34504 RepID=A0A5J4ND67_9TREM|nr:adenylate kinase [Paragonimus westermani]
MDEKGLDIKEQYIFVNNIDTYVPLNVGKYLANQAPGVPPDDDENEDVRPEEQVSEPAGPMLPRKDCYRITGTLSNRSNMKPLFAKDILDYDEKTWFYEHLMKNDVIIYDLTADANQAEEALWVAQEMERNFESFTSQKKLIIISNLMSWTTTKPADPEEPGFTEGEYRRRKPHANFKELFNLEKEILKLGKKHKKKFVTYVLACGLIYGNGEHLLRHIFRSNTAYMVQTADWNGLTICLLASPFSYMLTGVSIKWLNHIQQAWAEQTPLPIYFEGQNILPTIHVLDLANVILNVIENPPRQRYIVVKDESSNTLTDIVQAIATQLSTGEVIHLPTSELVNAEQLPASRHLLHNTYFLFTNCFEELSQSTLDQLTMDLKIESATIKEEMQVRWVSENGIVDSIPKLVTEFIETHNLKPTRICVLGPPNVGKTSVAKEICKTYRLHHIHLKAVIFETFRNLIEPIKALEHLHEMRRAEQAAAEASAAARQRELELAVTGEALGEEVVELKATGLAGQEAGLNGEEQLALSQHPTSGTYEADYGGYKFTSTADEIPSIRRSTFTETISDLEYYPLGPTPTWKSEDELELLVTDAQEQLENLRENTDENGRLNDETLVRLVSHKLLSRACQNQGFVLDGFPKTMAQAEMLFKPDPDDEDAMADDKRLPSHGLLIPHHVIVMEASNAYVLHRLFQKAAASGMDPTQARVIPPPWPIGFRLEKQTTLEPGESYLAPSESQQVTDDQRTKSGDATEEEGEEINAGEKHYFDGLETYHDRLIRRLNLYRAMMAPDAAKARERQITMAEKLAMEDAEAEKERLVIRSTMEETEREADDELVPEQGEEMRQAVEQVDLEKAREVLEVTYQQSLAARLAKIAPLPETPADTEENVLAFFDIREIHPLCLDMDKDFSRVSETDGYHEKCLDRIRRALGVMGAVTLPYCSAMPPKAEELEKMDQLEQQAQKARQKRLNSAKIRAECQAQEDRKLLQKQQDDWVSYGHL